MGQMSKIGPTATTPENMAEILTLAYDAQQANDAINQLGSPRERERAGEDTDESLRYKISPKTGTLPARKWKPDGRNWTSTGEEVCVTPDQPFVATMWTARTQGAYGIEFIFYNNDMERDSDGNAIHPVWELTVNARDLNSLTVIEENDGQVTSEWLGRHAIFGAVA